MDAHWLISFRTYGTWLPRPVDTTSSAQLPRARQTPWRRRPRGVRVRDGPRAAAAADPPPARAPRAANGRRPRARVSDGPPLPAVGRYASLAERAGPVHLTHHQASRLIAQLRETADARGWTLRAAAVTRDGVHTVIAVRGDPVPAVVIADLKSDGSRALSAARGGAPRRRWNEGGARARLDDEAAFSAAIRRVRDQPGALATWLDPRWPWR